MRLLRHNQKENRRLKQMYADISLENTILKEIIEKKALTPTDKRELVDFVKVELEGSTCKACKAVSLSRSVYRYQPDLSKDDPVIEMLRALAEKYPRYGFGKMFPIIRRGGYRWNHKHGHRIYCDLKLNIRRKGKKRFLILSGTAQRSR